ncbi:MAG: hypothetical protein LBC18_14300 [Opitutaceae bacterium]|jgi:hypothetical protein|nr:hypothetical protein [Opitutaceae bacterium]
MNTKTDTTTKVAKQSAVKAEKTRSVVKSATPKAAAAGPAPVQKPGAAAASPAPRHYPLPTLSAAGYKAKWEAVRASRLANKPVDPNDIHHLLAQEYQANYSQRMKLWHSPGYGECHVEVKATRYPLENPCCPLELIFTDFMDGKSERTVYSATVSHRNARRFIGLVSDALAFAEGPVPASPVAASKPEAPSAPDAPARCDDVYSRKISIAGESLYSFMVHAALRHDGKFVPAPVELVLCPTITGGDCEQGYNLSVEEARMLRDAFDGAVAFVEGRPLEKVAAPRAGGGMVCIPREVARNLAGGELDAFKNMSLGFDFDDIPGSIRRGLRHTFVHEKDAGEFYLLASYAYNYRALMQGLGEGAGLPDPLELVEDKADFLKYMEEGNGHE